MTKKELKIVLEEHGKWLVNNSTGQRVNLQGADLRWANLRWANLQEANLREANLQGADLRWADLRWANLRWADLQWANLQWANLQEANLRWANLQGADLQWANLKGANLQWVNFDLSVFPLSCGSFNMVVDDRLIWQLICHITRLNTENCSRDINAAMELLKPFANRFCSYRSDITEVI